MVARHDTDMIRVGGTRFDLYTPLLTNQQATELENHIQRNVPGVETVIKVSVRRFEVHVTVDALAKIRDIHRATQHEATRCLRQLGVPTR